MFGVGTTELMVIFLVILLLFGAKRLPELAQSLGRSMSEFKRGMNTVTRELEKETTGGTADNQKTSPKEA